MFSIQYGTYLFIIATALAILESRSKVKTDGQRTSPAGDPTLDHLHPGFMGI
ncbi:MAG: hypothetical protein R6U44_08110 [Archaeoglobaceae archaeon]